MGTGDDAPDRVGHPRDPRVALALAGRHERDRRCAAPYRAAIAAATLLLGAPRSAPDVMEPVPQLDRRSIGGTRRSVSRTTQAR